jgi:hypothetical protein
MTVWKPIETAPKDGTWVLLRGGDAQDGRTELYLLSPEEQEAVDRRPVVARWISHYSVDGWAYAAWDSDWRSFYFEPVEWMEIPG